MIIFFNLENIERASKYQEHKMLEILNDMAKGKVLQTTMYGRSFLRNFEEMYRQRVDILFKAQYVHLAARRSYSNYKLLGQLSLDLSYYPEISKDVIKTNPLIKISNNQVNFLFEENKEKLTWH